MIDQGQYMSAFELTNYVFINVGSVDMDDSDGYIGIFADQTYELWTEILSKAREEDKLKTFQWFIAHVNGRVLDFLEDYL